MTRVYKLKKNLYGLKQAPRAWYGRIDSFLMSMDFTKSKVGPNLYLNVMDHEPDILLLYVDDLFLTRNEKHIKDCKKKLAEDERSWIDALFPSVESVAEPKKNIFELGKVCSLNIEKI